MSSSDDEDTYTPPPPGFRLDHGQKLIIEKWQQIFVSQDNENENFDVTFGIQGKKLHAHIFMLSTQSETFKAMLSNRWSIPNVPIPISNYTFNDFKMFFGYMYFAPVQLTNNNFMTNVDMAEFYGVQYIKEKCDIWLSSQEKFSPLLEIFEATKTYLLIKSKTAIISYVRKNCLKTPEMIRDYGFPKEIIMEVVISPRSYASEESLFKAVYNWAMEKHRSLYKSLKSFHESLKAEFTNILPHIKFERMRKAFFKDFIRAIKHIFIEESWKSIESIFDKPQVILKSSVLILRGFLLADEYISHFIQHLGMFSFSIYGDRSGCYWKFTCKIPSKPNQLKIKENVPYYLCITADYHRIAVKKRSALKDGDYLLAEMYGARHRFTKDCEISVV